MNDDSKSTIPQQVYEPALTHKEVGKSISLLGIKKANTKSWQLLLLGILAGIYIAI